MDNQLKQSCLDNRHRWEIFEYNFLSMKPRLSAPLEMAWCRFETCPLCGASEANFQNWFAYDSVKAQKCSSCRFRFLNPYLSPESMIKIYSSHLSMAAVNEKLEKYYEDFEGSETEKGFQESLKILQDLGARGSLLDVGCGRGKFLEFARKSGWETVGIEPGAEHTLYAKEKLKMNVINASLEETQFPSGQFDVITLWDVIEHIENPKEVLKKLRVWLKPGGLILLATPSHESLLNFLARTAYVLSGGLIKKPLTYFFVPEHILYFTSASLRRLVKECGFVPVREMKTGTDIERYSVSPLVKIAAKILLPLAKFLRAENRMVWICRQSN